MYRARSSVRPPLPATKNDIHLSESWKKTKNGDDFLLVDDGNDENRILVCEYSSLKIVCLKIIFHKITLFLI